MLVIVSKELLASWIL